MVADAYHGRVIQTATFNFLYDAAGLARAQNSVNDQGQTTQLNIRGGTNLVVYLGHDGLVDFQLPRIPPKRGIATRQAVILACGSMMSLASALRASGTYLLLWTTNLMAPESVHVDERAGRLDRGN